MTKSQLYPALALYIYENGLQIAPNQVLGVHERVTLHFDLEIFSQISDTSRFGHKNSRAQVVTPQPIPEGLKFTKETPPERKFDIDDHCKRLTYLTAGEFAKVEIPEEASTMNKAVLTFIKSMPMHTVLVLNWGDW